MGLIQPRARLRAGLISAVLVVALAVPAAVSADTTPGTSGAAPITVGTTVHITAKVVATVDISFTCDPFLVYDWETGTYVPSTHGNLEFGEISLVQASGRSIASGSTQFRGGTVVCDGTTIQTRSIPIVATTLPWKSGAAVVSVLVDIVDDQFSANDIGDSGPVVVKLRNK